MTTVQPDRDTREWATLSQPREGESSGAAPEQVAVPPTGAGDYREPPAIALAAGARVGGAENERHAESALWAIREVLEPYDE